jgi:hypothetical protein
MLYAVVLIVALMLSVVLLNVIMLSVVARQKHLTKNESKCFISNT